LLIVGSHTTQMFIILNCSRKRERIKSCCTEIIISSQKSKAIALLFLKKVK